MTMINDDVAIIPRASIQVIQERKEKSPAASCMDGTDGWMDRYRGTAYLVSVFNRLLVRT